MVQKSNDDPTLKNQYGQGHAPKLTFNVPNFYHHQYGSPIEVEKDIKNEEHEEIAKENEEFGTKQKEYARSGRTQKCLI